MTFFVLDRVGYTVCPIQVNWQTPAKKKLVDQYGCHGKIPVAWWLRNFPPCIDFFSPSFVHTIKKELLHTVIPTFKATPWQDLFQWISFSHVRLQIYHQRNLKVLISQSLFKYKGNCTMKTTEGSLLLDTYCILYNTGNRRLLKLLFYFTTGYAVGLEAICHQQNWICGVTIVLNCFQI